MTRTSQADLDDFAQFCRQATDTQIVNIYKKEKDAGRKEYAGIARAEMAMRAVADYERIYGSK
jgi:hypothetical protein